MLRPCSKLVRELITLVPDRNQKVGEKSKPVTNRDSMVRPDPKDGNWEARGEGLTRSGGLRSFGLGGAKVSRADSTKVIADGLCRMQAVYDKGVG